jgi:hypothetical protein
MSRLSLRIAPLLALVAGFAAAQQPPAPETRKDDIEPAVNTSAPAPDAPAPAVSAGKAAKPAAASAPAAEAAPSAAASAPATAAAAAAAADAAKGRPAKGGKAMDRLELDTTQITGNRELPKVLYIVPWKRSDLGDMVGKPVNSLLDEVLQPVDRDVFQRENRYYRALTPPGSVTGAAAPATPPSPGSATNGSAARDEK